MKYALLLLLAGAVPVLAAWVPVFTPDFSGNFAGTGDHQFNYVGSALNGRFVQSARAVDGSFQMITAHQPASDINHSITRLSRHGNGGDAHALDIGRGAALLRIRFDWTPAAWPAAEPDFLSIQIGESFRSGAYNPGRGRKHDDGPSFAVVHIRAMKPEGTFALILSGEDENPPTFSIEKDPETGAYSFSLALALNNSDGTLHVDAPGGKHALNRNRISVWQGSTLVGDNLGTPLLIADADFQHVSIGFGNGVDHAFDSAEAFAGRYALRSFSVSKWVATTLP
jgi:hypothetical protein